MAIALDATTATSGSAGVTSKTFSHTCSGTDRILFVAAGKASARTITGVTYAGVAMTKIGEITQTAGNVTVQLWYLINPSTGANNVVISVDSSSSLSGGAISYTGADQASQPDAWTTGGNTTTGVTSYSQNLTTNTNNTYSVCAMLAASGAALTAGTDTTIASQPEVAAHGLAMTRSTTALASAGTENLTVTSSSQVMVGVMASIKEASAAATFIPKIRFLI